MTGWLPLTGEKAIDSSFGSEKMRDKVLDSDSMRVTYDTGIEDLRERVPDHLFEFDDIVADTAGSVLENHSLAVYYSLLEDGEVQT